MDNRINTYTCQKKHVTVTRDVDEGVTPMSKNCPICSQVAYSAGYRVDQTLKPTHEWYKPAHPERYLNVNMRYHCMQGGLAFRVIGDPDETLAMKPRDKNENSFSALTTRALTNSSAKRKKS